MKNETKEVNQTLIEASINGRTETIQALIEAGASLDLQDKYGDTALIWSARNGYTGIVQALIKAGASVDIQNAYHRTALISAAENGHTEIVQALIDANASLDPQDKSMSTAIFVAARNGHTEIVHALIEGGASADLKNRDGETALMWAAAYGHTEIVHALIESGATVDIKSKYGNTALIFSAESYHVEIVTALIDAKASVDGQNRFGETALMRAAENGDSKTVSALINANTPLNLKNIFGDSAMTKAAHFGYTEVVQALIDAGAAVDLQENKIRQVMSYAAKCGHLEIVNAMNEAGVQGLEKMSYSEMATEKRLEFTNFFNDFVEKNKEIIGNLIDSVYINLNSNFFIYNDETKAFEKKSVFEWSQYWAATDAEGNVFLIDMKTHLYSAYANPNFTEYDFDARRQLAESILREKGCVCCLRYAYTRIGDVKFDFMRDMYFSALTTDLIKPLVFNDFRKYLAQHSDFRNSVIEEYFNKKVTPESYAYAYNNPEYKPAYWDLCSSELGYPAKLKDPYGDDE